MGLIWLLVVSESQQWKQTCSCCVGPACSFGSWWLVLICSKRKVLLAGADSSVLSSGSGSSGSVTSALHCTALHCTQRFPLGRVRRQIITHTDQSQTTYGTVRNEATAVCMLHCCCIPPAHPTRACACAYGRGVDVSSAGWPPEVTYSTYEDYARHAKLTDRRITSSQTIKELSKRTRKFHQIWNV
jgi:hypothetical protein